MLTATYATIAIATEQDKTRNMLCRLQQYVETAWKSLHNLDLAFLDTAFGKLTQFDRYFRSRKIDLYLIPTLQGVNREADIIITEIAGSSSKAGSVLRSVGEQLGSVFEFRSAKANELFHSMYMYCRHVSVRIEREEKELLPLSRRLLSVDQWFSIAAQFLADDATGPGNRHGHAIGSSSSSSSRSSRSTINLH
ncbi:hypothetical protein [Noviherbaspirillum saxi]|uniref:Uncharacterized protein n=1 Tax=Noviherbaspirillum saxi TaxID=2320863 RepID=A0A3A3FPU6_9BURK|nr:hypothetical protein [Noviherbaspirillum saxi]RJF98046.1 hypothetical protein D3871_05595 [Noviherbaspirillum saxi]